MADPNVIVQYATDFLKMCDYWAFASKTVAVVLGVVVSAGGTLITLKFLPNNWHYALGATTAACLFAWTLLQPYEEYKQFRASYAIVEHATLQYQHTGNDKDLTALIDAIYSARMTLKETWPAPAFNAPPEATTPSTSAH